MNAKKVNKSRVKADAISFRQIFCQCRFLNVSRWWEESLKRIDCKLEAELLSVVAGKQCLDSPSPLFKSVMFLVCSIQRWIASFLNATKAAEFRRKEISVDGLTDLFLLRSKHCEAHGGATIRRILQLGMIWNFLFEAEGVRFICRYAKTFECYEATISKLSSTRDDIEWDWRMFKRNSFDWLIAVASRTFCYDGKHPCELRTVDVIQALILAPELIVQPTRSERGDKRL